MEYPPLVQKRIDRLREISKMTESENIVKLKEGSQAEQIMIEVRRLQMELMGFKSTTHLEGASLKLNPEIVDVLNAIKYRISSATDELHFERGREMEGFIKDPSKRVSYFRDFEV